MIDGNNEILEINKIEASRKEQLAILLELKEYLMSTNTWWAVVGGWAIEGHLRKPRPHNDVDVLVEKTTPLSPVNARVDFIVVDKDEGGGLTLPILPHGLLRAYIPPLGAELMTVGVEGIQFPALRPKTLLLLQFGKIKSWVPVMGNWEPELKYQYS